MTLISLYPLSPRSSPIYANPPLAFHLTLCLPILFKYFICFSAFHQFCFIWNGFPARFIPLCKLWEVNWGQRPQKQCGFFVTPHRRNMSPLKLVALSSVGLQMTHPDIGSATWTTSPLTKWQSLPHCYSHIYQYGQDGVSCIPVHLSWHQWRASFFWISLHGWCERMVQSDNDVC